MAVAIITRFPEGVGAEQYDAVTNEMGFRFQVFSVWEAPENAERFLKDRLRPAQVAIKGEDRVAALPDAAIIHGAIHKYLIP